jgi:hypothetical protein
MPLSIVVIQNSLYLGSNSSTNSSTRKANREQISHHSAQAHVYHLQSIDAVVNVHNENST